MTQSYSPPTPLPDHPALSLIRECIDVTTNALACLTNEYEYDQLSAIYNNWIDWLYLHPSQAAGCDSWLSAFDLFWNSYEQGDNGKFGKLNHTTFS